MSYLPTFQFQKTTDTYSHPNGTTEQDLVVIDVTDEIFNAGALALDLSNLTEAATFRFYLRIDGTNHRQVDGMEIIWGPANEDGLVFNLSLIAHQDFRVTIQSGIAEGAARDIPYTLTYGTQ